MRLLPWGILFSFISLGMLYLGIAGNRPFAMSNYQCYGLVAQALWMTLIGIASKYALGNSRWEGRVLYTAMGLVIAQSVYEALLDNMHEPSLFAVAAVCMVLPCITTIPPRHYRVLLGLQLGALLWGLVSLIPSLRSSGNFILHYITLVALSSAQRSGALALAERLLKEVPTMAVSSEYDIPITVSIGLAFSQESNSPKALMELVDERLYKAKQTGRNRIVGP